MIGRLFRSRTFLAHAFLFLFLFPLIAAAAGSLTDISALEAVAAGEAEIPIRTLFGREIYTYRTPQYGEKVSVPLEDISEALIAVTIATEDRTFFANPGFSPGAIVRAIFQNLYMRTTFSGASTITQQVVRNILLSPQERYERTIFRKAKEILLAFRVSLHYDKETILSLYLNEIYYGQNATGVEKASEIYFDRHASELDLAEAAFIAGLPQAPNYYGLDREAGIRRQREVLNVMKRIILEDRCIPLGTGKDSKSYCPTAGEIDAAMFSPMSER